MGPALLAWGLWLALRFGISCFAEQKWAVRPIYVPWVPYKVETYPQPHAGTLWYMLNVGANMCAYIYIYTYSCIHTLYAQNFGFVGGPGSAFATQVCNSGRGLATTPSATDPFKDYRALQRGPRQRS